MLSVAGGLGLSAGRPVWVPSCLVWPYLWNRARVFCICKARLDALSSGDCFVCGLVDVGCFAVAVEGACCEVRGGVLGVGGLYAT